LSKINFREWTKNDFDNVREILLSTWIDTYSKIIPAKELKAYLNISCSDEKLNELVNDDFTKGTIAETDYKPAGWLRTNINKTENRFYVVQLYVLPDYQGMGIGKKLMKIAEKEAIQNNYDKIWLGVMSENILSVNWYKALGFIFEEEAPFRMIDTTVHHLIGWKEIKKSTSSVNC